MPSKCFPVVRGSVLRVTRLDNCGRPVYGDCSRVVTDGVVSVALTANFTEADAINVVNFAGNSCVNVPAKSTFLNYTVNVTFCRVDPELFAMMTCQEAIYDPFTGDAIGYRTEDDVDPFDCGFALELWSVIPGQACSEQGEVAAGYLLLPFVRGGVFGDKTFENAAVNFTLTNAQTVSGSGWGSGPYNVMFDAAGNPAPLQPTVSASEHERVFYTEIAPPEAMCGCQPLLEPEMTFTSTVTGDTVELDFTGTASTPEDPGFIVIDWGDGSEPEVVQVMTADPQTGEWTQGPVSHAYADPDTYTVKATYYSATQTEQIEVMSS